MADIKFRDTAHRDFFLENMMKCRVNDCYHRAFFYVMGIASETRATINQMFNFKEDCIEPEGMHGGWQTSGTVKVCHLAFNLWNGYADPSRGCKPFLCPRCFPDSKIAVDKDPTAGAKND